MAFYGTDAIYGQGWEDRTEVKAQLAKIRSSHRMACQFLMDEGVLYSTVNDSLIEQANDYIEQGKVTPHGRI